MRSNANLSVDPEILLLEAELGRRSFYDFVLLAWSTVESATFVDNWHIGAICDHLQAVTEGQITNLLINVPPGCSKSLLTCVFWPAWEWTRDTSVRGFFASYDQKLSTRNAVNTRVLIESEWYRQRWPHVELRKDQNQKTYYETIDGGYRLATTPRGHATGEHPDRIVFDDPHNVKQAESEQERESTIDWWDMSMSTRGRARGARRVGIMQRLHERDLAGHVLETGVDSWVHICLPMRYEPARMTMTPLGWNDPRETPGELLWPALFPEDVVAEMERSLGAYGTAGQLQQRPHPKGGGMFKREYFEIVSIAPAKAQRCRFWDKAGSSRDSADWTVGVLMARVEPGIYYVEDVIRGQWEPHERDKIIAQTAEADRQRYGNVAIGIEQEPGNGGKQSAQISVKQLAGYTVFLDRPTANKEVRAEPFASQAGAGNVKLVSAPWNQQYLDELIRFPNGAHDDQVDASSGAFNRLALRRQYRITGSAAIPGGQRR